MVTNNVLIRGSCFNIVMLFWVSLLPFLPTSPNCMACYNTDSPISEVSKSRLIFWRSINCVRMTPVELSALQNTPMHREKWFLYTGKAGVSCQDITSAHTSTAATEAGSCLGPLNYRKESRESNTLHIFCYWCTYFFAYKVYFYKE